MSMESGIGKAVVGAIILIVVATVLPTIFGAFSDTYQLTEAGCVISGERFINVSSDQDWASSGTVTAVTKGATTGDKSVCSISGSGTVYTPDGSSITAATAVSGSEWVETLSILEENSGINRLIITALPILSIVGVLGLLMVWWRGRGNSSMV